MTLADADDVSVTLRSRQNEAGTLGRVLRAAGRRQSLRDPRRARCRSARTANGMAVFRHHNERLSRCATSWSARRRRRCRAAARSNLRTSRCAPELAEMPPLAPGGASAALEGAGRAQMAGGDGHRRLRAARASAAICRHSSPARISTCTCRTAESGNIRSSTRPAKPAAT